MATSGVLSEEQPRPEADSHAQWLFAFTNLFQNWRFGMESRRHGPFDPGPPEQPNYEQRLRQLEGFRDDLEREPRQVNWGNQGTPPQKTRRDELIEAVSHIVQKLVILAIGFLFGAVWNHEHRISYLEGGKLQVPHVGSP